MTGSGQLSEFSRLSFIGILMNSKFAETWGQNKRIWKMIFIQFCYEYSKNNWPYDTKIEGGKRFLSTVPRLNIFKISEKTAS